MIHILKQNRRQEFEENADEYELFSAVTCDVPEGAPSGSKIYPAWTTLSINTDGCYYAAPADGTPGNCTLPEGHPADATIIDPN